MDRQNSKDDAALSMNELLDSMQTLGITTESQQQHSGTVDDRDAMIVSYVEQLPTVAEWLATVPPREELDINDPDIMGEIQKLVNTVQVIRKVSAVERNPPLAEILDSGSVPLLTQFLYWDESPQLQFEAAWAVMNVASGTSDFTAAVVECGAIEAFIHLLGSPHHEVIEQGIWGLGNVAGDGPHMRNLVLEAGVLDACYQLGPMFGNGPATVSLEKNFIWAVSNFVRSKPPPPSHFCEQALPIVSTFLDHNEPECVIDALWGMSYLADTPHAVEIIPLLPSVMCHFESEKAALMTPALRVLGSLVFTDDETTQAALDQGVLNCFATVVASPNATPQLLKEAFWAISNLAAGTLSQTKEVEQLGLVRLAGGAMMFDGTTPQVLKEATFCVTNHILVLSDENVLFDAMPAVLDYLEPLLYVVAHFRERAKEDLRKAVGEALDAIFGESSRFEDVVNYASEKFGARLFKLLNIGLPTIPDLLMTLLPLAPMPNVATMLGIEEAVDPQQQKDAVGSRPEEAKKMKVAAEDEQHARTKKTVAPTSKSNFDLSRDQLSHAPPAALMEHINLLDDCVRTLCEQGAHLSVGSEEYCEETLWAAVIFIRKLTSCESDPPLRAIVDADQCVAALIEITGCYNLDIVFEAAWALTNLCSGDQETTEVVIGQGVVEAFIRVGSQAIDGIDDQSTTLMEQIVWGLGNVAGDSTRARDHVVNCGGLQLLLQVLPRSFNVTALLRNSCWSLCNLCRGKPTNDLVISATAEIVTALLPLWNNGSPCDEEAATDALWAFSYLSECHDSALLNVVSPVIPIVMNSLLSATTILVTPALRVVGNLLTGNDMQTQMLINSGVIPSLLNLTQHSKRQLRKEAWWSFSNVAAGTKDQIQAMINAMVVPAVINTVSTEASMEVVKEAVWTLSNMTSGGNREQLAYLVAQGAVDAFMSRIAASPQDTRLAQVCDEGLSNLIASMRETNEPHLDSVVSLLESEQGAAAMDALRNMSEQNATFQPHTLQFLDEREGN